MIFEEQFPVPRYTAASKIGNSVISLLWQLRCRCNPDHNKFSFLSNTTVVAIIPNLCLWRRSSCLNLGGIDPEKLYRATLRAVLSNFQFSLTARILYLLEFLFIWLNIINIASQYFYARATLSQRSVVSNSEIPLYKLVWAARYKEKNVFFFLFC